MTPRSSFSRWAVYHVARVMLGLVFGYLGLAKTMDPVGFLKLLRVFEVLPTPLLLTVTAAVLPWLEVFCGALLVLGLKTRSAAAVTLLLLVGFTVAVAVHAAVLYQAGTLPFCAITFDCGCGNGPLPICGKLAENVSLSVLAWFVCWSPSESRKARSSGAS